MGPFSLLYCKGSGTRAMLHCSDRHASKTLGRSCVTVPRDKRPQGVSRCDDNRRRFIAGRVTRKGQSELPKRSPPVFVPLSDTLGMMMDGKETQSTPGAMINTSRRRVRDAHTGHHHIQNPMILLDPSSTGWRAASCSLEFNGLGRACVPVGWARSLFAATVWSLVMRRSFMSAANALPSVQRLRPLRGPQRACVVVEWP